MITIGRPWWVQSADVRGSVGCGCASIRTVSPCVATSTPLPSARRAVIPMSGLPTITSNGATLRLVTRTKSGRGMTMATGFAKCRSTQLKDCGRRYATFCVPSVASIRNTSSPTSLSVNIGSTVNASLRPSSLG